MRIDCMCLKETHWGKKKLLKINSKQGGNQAKMK